MSEDPYRAPSASPTAPPPLPSDDKRIGDDVGMRILLPVGRSGWAIAAGYLGLLSMVLLPAPIAVIVSIIAIRDVQRSKHDPHPKRGMGRAVFGLVMGLLFSLFLAILLIRSMQVS